ncbi:hypothetical protein HOLleu_40566 [Holothuria leucospilota]|uniref:Secreted protein n=1 Tax=Holothuria leucospilota TaxID=206669 RepID=A0A9Q0YDT3_HOLLE|nr:hypothetical protein HOLleu_40566 [Holothuria leucospilota]
MHCGMEKVFPLEFFLVLELSPCLPLQPNTPQCKLTLKGNNFHKMNVLFLCEQFPIYHKYGSPHPLSLKAVSRTPRLRGNTLCTGVDSFQLRLILMSLY